MLLRVLQRAAHITHEQVSVRLLPDIYGTTHAGRRGNDPYETLPYTWELILLLLGEEGRMLQQERREGCFSRRVREDGPLGKEGRMLQQERRMLNQERRGGCSTRRDGEACSTRRGEEGRMLHQQMENGSAREGKMTGLERLSSVNRRQSSRYSYDLHRLSGGASSLLRT